MAPAGMNVMIPLGGIGSRFQKEGYKYPKPFVRVLGKEMIVGRRLAEITQGGLAGIQSAARHEEWVEMVAPRPGTILVELPGQRAARPRRCGSGSRA